MSLAGLRPLEDDLLSLDAFKSINKAIRAERAPRVMAKKLRVGYVPEHFCSPLLQFAAQDDSIELVSLPSGTGQHISSLDAGEVDVSIALTEALLAGIAKGKTSYKLVGHYVSSPLNWGIIVGKDSKHQTVADLRGGKIGISRIGSGSQVMASVLALREHWTDPATKAVEPLHFEVRDTFKGLRDGVNGEDAFFMWELFTTKPFVDSGEVRFVGSIPTPWPSWAIVATPSTDTKALKAFLEGLSKRAQHFDSAEARKREDVDFIKKQFNYPEEDVVAWLKTVSYPADCAKLPKSMVFDTLKLLDTAGVVKTPSEGWQLEQFVRTDVADVH